LRTYDENAYGLQHHVECFTNKIKHYRRIATRFGWRPEFSHFDFG
jgi:transposase